jgi:RNA polymerase sigma factor (sigma-70 family)
MSEDLHQVSTEQTVNEEQTQTPKSPELQEKELTEIQLRTNQLFELIAFDPKNSTIYMNEVTELNIKLVPHVLKKYRPYGDDEFQLGCLGLIIATRTFDTKRGVPFSSYACFCIERELHKAHRYSDSQFEAQVGKDNLESLDALVTLPNGDEANKYEQIADFKSQEAFDELVEENSLSNFFEKVILPAIDEISKKTKGQVAKVDFDVWRQLELRYLLELAREDSQKARLTLNAIAKELNMSTQNIRMRHLRVVDNIRKRCKALGYHV